MKTRIALTAVTLALLAGLTGCGKEGGHSADKPGAAKIDWISYRGHKIACVEVDGHSSFATRSCDFARFYAEHPELLAPKKG